MSPDLRYRIQNLASIGLPQGRDLPADIQNTGLPEPTAQRKIGRGKKRLFVRGQQHGHGPSPPARNHMAGRHINSIDIRTLFPIHFDADKCLVQGRGCLGIFKRFFFHDMTPVAGGISDRQKNGLLGCFGKGKGGIPPRVPVYRIVGMLQQIGTFFVNQAVGRWHISSFITLLEEF